jgi:hypothetical protein
MAAGGQHRGETPAAVSAWIAQSVACQDGGCSRPRTMARTSLRSAAAGAVAMGTSIMGRL